MKMVKPEGIFRLEEELNDEVRKLFSSITAPPIKESSFNVP